MCPEYFVPACFPCADLHFLFNVEMQTLGEKHKSAGTAPETRAPPIPAMAQQ
jgi:hypothetical protein